jgi:hypothetical protein
VHPFAWEIVTACDATVRVPVRAGPLFAATLNCAEPLPVLSEPPVTEIHDSLLVVVQVQAEVVVTETENPVAAEAPTDWLVGLIEYVHGGGTGAGGAAAWVMVNCWPAMVSVVERSLPGFGATSKRAVPLPVPPVPPGNAIQVAVSVAFHVQLPFVLTVRVAPLLPAEGNDWDEIETWNRPDPERHLDWAGHLD